MDPELRRFLDQRASEALSPEPTSDSERALLNRDRLLAALVDRPPIAGLPNDVLSRAVELGAALKGRLYLPAAPPEPLAVLVYFHGGGWVCGSSETHDPFCRLLAEAAAVSILSVDYRLAPEHPHPAALEDAFEAVRWAAHHAASWGGDVARLVIAGDSAGANVAAAVANRLDSGTSGIAFCAQILLYPVTDHPSASHASYAETGYGFGAEFMHWVWRMYAGATSADDPDVSPLRRSPLRRLPPTFVATAEHDILRNEGLAYVDKLRSAGTPVVHHHSPDMHHNFLVNPGTVGRFPQCQEALQVLATWLRRTSEVV